LAIGSAHYLSVGETLMLFPQWNLRGKRETLRRFRGFTDVRFSRYADSKLRVGPI
jgi:hypothetical protein